MYHINKNYGNRFTLVPVIVVTEWCTICLPQGLTSLSQVCDHAKCDVSIVEALLKHGAKMDEKRAPPLLTAVRRYAVVIQLASMLWNQILQGILQLVYFRTGCAVTLNQVCRWKVFVHSIFFQSYEIWPMLLHSLIKCMWANGEQWLKKKLDHRSRSKQILVSSLYLEQFLP